jgi:hypothetical protein
LAIAAEWTTRILTISAEMAIPGLAGNWLDRRLGTKVLFTLLGVGLGMALAGWELMKIVQAPPSDPPEK